MKKRRPHLSRGASFLVLIYLQIITEFILWQSFLQYSGLNLKYLLNTIL
jgi:hypothetical protein